VLGNDGPSGRGQGWSRWKWRLALILGVVSLAFVILWGMGRLDRRPDDPAAVTKRRSAPPKAPLLNHRGDEAPPALPQVAVAAGSDARDESRLDPVGEPTSYQNAVRRRYVRRLEDRWRGESGDSSWTKKVEAWLSDEFRKRSLLGTIDRVDCRKTLCKTNVHFESPNDAMALYAIEVEPTNQWFSDFRQEGSRTEVTMFFGAPGVDLRSIGDDPQIR
jgi:hypothetical protein